MATIKRHEDSPFKIWMQLAGVAGAVFKGISAHKTAKKAEGLEADAKKARDGFREDLANMNMTNPFEGMQNQFAGMENTMEDLTVNQKEAEFASQQFAQSQSNIMSGLRGAAGGSGIAALAQQLAQQGQIAAQKQSADIGRQEAQNQMAERREASRIQGLEIGGEIQKREDEAYKTQTLLGMAQQNYASKKEAQAAAKQQKWDAITGTVTGAADMFAGFGQGDGTTE